MHRQAEVWQTAEAANQLCRAFVDDVYSDIIVGAGAYPDTETAIPDSVGLHSLDSIAIRDGVKLTMWSGESFTGQVLLEVWGPAVVYNKHWDGAIWPPMGEAKAKLWDFPLRTEFPRRFRIWSTTDMYDSDGDGQPPFDQWWEKGSFKIEE